MGANDQYRENLRHYVTHVMERTEINSYSALAHKIGVSPSTIHRFMNSDVAHMLSNKTVGGLYALSGIAPPLFEPESPKENAFAEALFKANIHIELPYEMIWQAKQHAETALKEHPVKGVNAEQIATKMLDMCKMIPTECITLNMARWVVEMIASENH